MHETALGNEGSEVEEGLDTGSISQEILFDIDTDDPERITMTMDA
jgi:hypothetical protein